MNSKTIIKTILAAHFIAMSITAQPFTFTGRVGVSADGNQHANDDYGASPWSVAMLAVAGADYVHHDYANHLGDNNPDMEANMIESTVGAAERFYGDASMTYNCQTDLQGAIDNIAAQINMSSAADTFYFLLGGPMEVPWRGIMASDPDKRQYCVCITHSPWNDDHTGGEMTHKWDDVVATGIVPVRIPNQNPNLHVDRSDFNWAINHEDPNIQWLMDRTPGGDISDAGMALYLVTGYESGTPDDMRVLMEQGYDPTGDLFHTASEHAAGASRTVRAFTGGNFFLPENLPGGIRAFAVFDAGGRELHRSVVSQRIMDTRHWGVPAGNVCIVRLFE